MATIKVTIDKFGNPQIEAAGFKGSKCDLATASLEAALKQGADSSNKTRTAEFYDDGSAVRRTVKTGG